MIQLKPKPHSFEAIRSDLFISNFPTYLGEFFVNIGKSYQSSPSLHGSQVTSPSVKDLTFVIIFPYYPNNILLFITNGQRLHICDLSSKKIVSLTPLSPINQNTYGLSAIGDLFFRNLTSSIKEPRQELLSSYLPWTPGIQVVHFTRIKKSLTSIYGLNKSKTRGRQSLLSPCKETFAQAKAQALSTFSLFLKESKKLLLATLEQLQIKYEINKQSYNTINILYHLPGYQLSDAICLRYNNTHKDFRRMQHVFDAFLPTLIAYKQQCLNNFSLVVISKTLNQLVTNKYSSLHFLKRNNSVLLPLGVDVNENLIVHTPGYTINLDQIENVSQDLALIYPSLNLLMADIKNEQLISDLLHAKPTLPSKIDKRSALPSPIMINEAERQKLIQELLLEETKKTKKTSPNTTSSVKTSTPIKAATPSQKPSPAKVDTSDRSTPSPINLVTLKSARMAASYFEGRFQTVSYKKERATRSPIQKMLNDLSMGLKLDERVSRWLNITKIDDIRKFPDLNKSSEHRYEHLSSASLREQMILHTIPMIIPRLLMSEYFKAHYTKHIADTHFYLFSEGLFSKEQKFYNTSYLSISLEQERIYHYFYHPTHELARLQNVTPPNNLEELELDDLMTTIQEFEEVDTIIRTSHEKNGQLPKLMIKVFHPLITDTLFLILSPVSE